MSLRTRLFFLFGGLIAVFALAQGWLVRALSHDVEHAVDDVAFRVGSSLVSLLVAPSEDAPAAPGHRAVGAAVEPFRIVLVGEGELESHPAQIVWSKRFRAHASPTLAVEPLASAELAEVRAPEGTRVERAMVVDLELATAHEFEGVSTLDPPEGLAAPELRATRADVLAKRAAGEGTDARYVPIPRERMASTLERFHSRLFLGSLALFAVAVVVAGWVAHRVSVPLRSLARASEEIGTGRLGRQVEVGGDREVSAAIRAFNAMSTKLAALDEETRALRERQHLGEIGELARGLAHSLRNPLHGLGLALEELAGGAPHERGRELADGARLQIRRIDRSLRSFLALSTAGAGAHEEVALDELARDVALEILQDGRGRVRVEVDVETPPPRVQGVAPEVRAMLQALVVNAAEASPAGAVVRVRVERGPRGARVLVDDRGSGLAPAVRERLFTPHVTTKEQGSGLGLYLSQRIAATRYGGALRLEDREGGGTRAVLELGDRGARA